MDKTRSAGESCPLPSGLDIVEVGGGEAAPYYGIEAFMGRRYNANTGQVKYHTRWRHWGPFHNKWLPLGALDGAETSV